MHLEMPKSSPATLEEAIQTAWPGVPSAKARRYIGAFFDAVRSGAKIMAKVVGNHGNYTVSIEVKEGALVSACSCYIGKGGFCHHCEALARTFLQDPSCFREVNPKERHEVQSLSDLRQYLQNVTLEELFSRLREQGITQKAFAESIGMSPRHLAAVKASEARHRHFHELGAIKLACLWVLEHAKEVIAP